jgi:putative DNA methylase
MNPWNYFKATIKRGDVTGGDIRRMRFPLADARALAARHQVMTTSWFCIASAGHLSSYEEKASLGKRPEEVDQEWLYAQCGRRSIVTMPTWA